MDKNSKTDVCHGNFDKVQYFAKKALAKRNICGIVKMSNNIAEVSHSPETFFEEKNKRKEENKQNENNKTYPFPSPLHGSGTGHDSRIRQRSGRNRPGNLQIPW